MCCTRLSACRRALFWRRVRWRCQSGIGIGRGSGRRDHRLRRPRHQDGHAARPQCRPEPFSNWFASIGEDLAVFRSIWLIFHHPILMLILIVCFLALVVWLIPKLLRLAKRGFQALRDRLARSNPDQPAPTGSPQLG